MSQKSLGAFGFKKSILHRGIREDIALSGDANENPFPCTFPNCPQRFKSKKGRTQHAIAKHGSTSSAILQPSQVDEDVIEEIYGNQWMRVTEDCLKISLPKNTMHI